MEGSCCVNKAGLASGVEAIASATHSLVQSFVYVSGIQVSSTFELICQLTWCETDFWVSAFAVL